jgi:uncharacterized protein (TIGR03000 family)
MRKTLLTLSLVAITLLAAANDVFAQRRGGRGGRGGVSVGVGVGGFYGYYGSPYYYGRRGYYYGYEYAPGYYDNTPGYYYSDSVTQPPAAEYRQSSYSEPNTATLTIVVPNSDAQVWFDGSPTSQRGMERAFHTPALQQAGTYTIKVRWTENGRTIDQERRVRVQPGQSVMVDFRASPAERLPSPRP